MLILLFCFFTATSMATISLERRFLKSKKQIKIKKFLSKDCFKARYSYGICFLVISFALKIPVQVFAYLITKAL